MALKRLAKAVRGQFRLAEADADKAAYASASMKSRAPGTQRTEHKSDQQSAAATNNHRQKNGKHSTTSVGFMGARQADAVANERPNAGDHSTTNRYHLQRTRRAMRESQNAESSFKWLVCAANDHQTDMHTALPMNNTSTTNRSSRMRKTGDPTPLPKNVAKGAWRIAKEPTDCKTNRDKDEKT